MPWGQDEWAGGLCEDKIFCTFALFTMTESRTYHSIDVAKLVAAFFVVAIHASFMSGVIHVVVIGLLARMAVPFFFTVSAFFFFRKNGGTAQLRHYLKRMGLLYVFWFIVELPMVIERSFVMHDSGFWDDLVILLRNLVLNSTFRGSWFIMALMLAIPVVYYVGKRLSTGWALVLGLVFYVPLTLLSNYFYYLPVEFQRLFLSMFRNLGFIHNSFLVAIVFCAMGKLIAEHGAQLDKIPGWVIDWGLLLCVAGAAVEVLSHRALFDDLYFMLVPMTAVLLLWLLRHETRWHGNYLLMRNQSTITYFSHFVFIYLLRNVMDFRPGTFGFYLLVLTLCYFLTVIMRWLSGKRQFSWVRLGY